MKESTAVDFPADAYGPEYMVQCIVVAIEDLCTATGASREEVAHIVRQELLKWEKTDGTQH